MTTFGDFVQSDQGVFQDTFGNYAPLVKWIEVDTSTATAQEVGQLPANASIVDVKLIVDVASSNNVGVSLGTAGDNDAFMTLTAINSKGASNPDIGSGKRGDVGASNGGPITLVTKMSGAASGSPEVYIAVSYR